MKNHQRIKQELRRRRQIRGRAKITGTAARPRLSVFRSLNNIYAQLIDDGVGKTLISASGKELKGKNKKKLDEAFAVGELLGQKAVKANLKEIVFDRRGYKFHGRVKALASGARQAGLEF